MERVVARLDSPDKGIAGLYASNTLGATVGVLWTAPLTFNVGVEIGQSIVVGVAWLVYLAVRRMPATVPARIAALYAIGIMAA